MGGGRYRFQERHVPLLPRPHRPRRRAVLHHQLAAILSVQVPETITVGMLSVAIYPEVVVTVTRDPGVYSGDHCFHRLSINKF